MIFESTHAVRFSDCDPAGIVFFPQYLVMLNGNVERWFDTGVQVVTFAGLHRDLKMSVPTVRLECDFAAPSYHGDTLTLQLHVAKLGNSSLELRHHFRSPEGELRMQARQVMVWASMETRRAAPWPDAVRAAMQRFVEPQGD